MAYVTNRLQTINGGRDFCLDIVLTLAMTAGSHVPLPSNLAYW